MSIHLIQYAQRIAGWEYGAPVDVYISHNRLCLTKPKNLESESDWTKITVCGYVAHVLWVWLTKFPGDSSRDINSIKLINGKIIDEFRRRTAYLLTSPEWVTEESELREAA